MPISQAESFEIINRDVSLIVISFFGEKLIDAFHFFYDVEKGIKTHKFI